MAIIIKPNDENPVLKAIDLENLGQDKRPLGRAVDVRKDMYISVG